MKLNDLAQIQSGLVLSRKQARGQHVCRYPLLNLRAIHSDGQIDLEQIDIYDASEPLKPEYITAPGDLVVRLSSPYTAILIDEKTSGMVISSNFVMIRTDASQLLPEYLFWLLHTPKLKRDILLHIDASMLGTIKASYFSQLDIDLLSLSDQAKIAELNRLAHQEKELLSALVGKKEQLYTMLLQQIQYDMIKGNHHDHEK